MMSSSFLPSTICLNGATGILRRNQNSGERYAVCGRMMMSSRSINNPCPSMEISSPWLMLPPTLDKSRGGMLYNLYSLADDKVLVLRKYGAGMDPIVSPDDDARVVGSSHGWLALMNRRNNDLFLSDPVSRRHIKLPPVDALPHPEFNLRGGGRARVSRVIVSASPDDEECRAVMSFGPGDRLAFCRPGRSKSWTPIGDLILEEGGTGTGGYLFARVYEDFVYSSRSNLFTCLVLYGANDDVILEDWDLRSSEIHWTQTEALPEIEFGDGCYWLRESAEKDYFRRGRRILKHLVYVERSDELLVLFRYTNLYGGATVGFTATKVERNGGKVRLFGTWLEGLAVFVGTNHSFAVSAAEFPRLKPNSIYFTDNNANYRLNFEGDDIGVFDCRHGTFSSCYYPFHGKMTIVPPPIWFAPALP